MEGILSWEDLVKDKVYNAGRLFPVRAESQGACLQPLKCGLTEKRLVNPAKGLNCLHQACIELSALFAHIERVRKWECPLCLAPLPYYQIFIDLRVSQILSKLTRKGDLHTNRVEIYSDGTWKLEKHTNSTLLPVPAHPIDSSNSVVSLYPLDSIPPDAKPLASFVDAHKDPAYLLQFPWNSNDVLAFDFLSHRWAPLVNFTNTLRKYSYFTSIYASAQDLYVCGGVDYEYYQTALLHHFNPNSGLTRKKAMTLPRSHFPGVHISGYIYVFGGLCNGETLASCEKYSISQDMWQDIAPMPAGRSCHVAAARQDQTVLVIAGSEFSGQTSTILIYDAKLDNWTSLGLSLPHLVESPHIIT